MGRRENPIFARLVEQAIAKATATPVADVSELENRIENEIAYLAAEMPDEDLHALAEAQPHLFRDRMPDYFPDGPESGIDLIERNLRELAVERALAEVMSARSGAEEAPVDFEQRDCANASSHRPHEWMFDGGKMWCSGKTDPRENAGIFRVDQVDGQPRFRSHRAEAKRFLSELVWHPEADEPFVRESLGMAAATFSGEFAAHYILSELYLELVKRGVRHGWLYGELRDLLAITKTPEDVADERTYADQVLAQAGVSAVDVQHPFNAATGKWMAHCVACGEYVDDDDHEPAADFLCDACEERDE